MEEAERTKAPFPWAIANACMVEAKRRVVKAQEAGDSAKEIAAQEALTTMTRVLEQHPIPYVTRAQAAAVELDWQERTHIPYAEGWVTGTDDEESLRTVQRFRQYRREGLSNPEIHAAEDARYAALRNGHGLANSEWALNMPNRAA